jgi:hypothetical protein
LKFFFTWGGFTQLKRMAVYRGQASHVQEWFNAAGRNLLAMTLFQMANAWWSWT